MEKIRWTNSFKYLKYVLLLPNPTASELFINRIRLHDSMNILPFKKGNKSYDLKLN